MNFVFQTVLSVAGQQKTMRKVGCMGNQLWETPFLQVRMPGIPVKFR